MASLGMIVACRWTALASLCLLAGCSKYDGDQRLPLNGTVRVDGQSMELGIISFIPFADTQRVSGGPIQNGAYSVDEELGANSGAYRVEIRWQKKTGRMVTDPQTGDLYEERKEGLPDRYHKDSQLKVETSPGNTKFDFDLVSGAPAAGSTATPPQTAPKSTSP